MVPSKVIQGSNVNQDPCWTELGQVSSLELPLHAQECLLVELFSELKTLMLSQDISELIEQAVAVVRVDGACLKTILDCFYNQLAFPRFFYSQIEVD